MIHSLEEIKKNMLIKLDTIENGAELEEWYVSVLGRSGSLTSILRGMAGLSKEERAAMGKSANLVKQELEARFAERKAKVDEYMQEMRFKKEAIDVTEPGKRDVPLGRLHPLTQVYREIRDALVGMGFTTFEGAISRLCQPSIF